MRTVVIGGTFNPVHIGHLYLAEEVKQQLEYERVIFVPSNIPAHKKMDGCTTPEVRLEMLHLATEANDIIVDDSEIRRGGISYMIKTIDDLESRYTVNGRIGMVIGDDLVGGLPKWKQWTALQKKVDLIVAHRKRADKVDCPYPHEYIDNIILPISSSGIRDRIKSGRAFRYLVPELVYRYIVDRGLYRGC